MTGQATINNDGVGPGFYVKRRSLYVAELEKQVPEHLCCSVMCVVTTFRKVVIMCFFTGNVVCAFSFCVLTHTNFLVCYIVRELLISDTSMKRERGLMQPTIRKGQL